MNKPEFGPEFDPGEKKKLAVDERASRGKSPYASGDMPADEKIGREGKTLPGSNYAPTYGSKFVKAGDFHTSIWGQSTKNPEEIAMENEKSAAAAARETIKNLPVADMEEAEESEGEELSDYDEETGISSETNLEVYNKTIENINEERLHELTEEIDETKKKIRVLESKIEDMNGFFHPFIVRRTKDKLWVLNTRLKELNQEKHILSITLEAGPKEAENEFEKAQNKLKVEGKRQILQTKEEKENAVLRKNRGSGERPARKPVGKPQADKRRAA